MAALGERTTMLCEKAALCVGDILCFHTIQSLLYPGVSPDHIPSVEYPWERSILASPLHGFLLPPMFPCCGLGLLEVLMRGG